MSNYMNKKVFTEEEKQKIAPFLDRMRACGVAPKYFYDSFFNYVDSEAKTTLFNITESRAKIIESFFNPEPRCLVIEGSADKGEDLLSLLVRMCAINGLGVKLYYSMQEFLHELENSEDAQIYNYAGIAFANFYDNDFDFNPLPPATVYEVQMFIKTNYLLQCKPVFISGNGAFSQTKWWTSMLIKGILPNVLSLKV